MPVDAARMSDAIAGPATRRVVDTVLEVWPEHQKFLRKSFAAAFDDLAETREIVAELLVKMAEDQGRPLASWAEDYRFLCEEIVFPEELFFRRNDRYRLSTFAEANAEVYANAPLMARYMNGLFVSDVLWSNHAGAMNHFARDYLGKLPDEGTHLEIGPGHGMLLHLAIRSGRFRTLAAWDVSATSVAHARHVLSVAGDDAPVDLRERNLYDPEATAAERGRYSTIVFSEVLEHLEEPKKALEIIRALLAPHGTVWINVPANGPAPDHLFLLRDLGEAQGILRSAGLEPLEWAAFPVTGSSLERAVRESLPVSYVLVARATPGGDAR
jgi:SAM-dependent methyltransferase